MTSSYRADMKVMQSQIAALAESLARPAVLTIGQPTSTPTDKTDLLVEKNKSFLRSLSLNQVYSRIYRYPHN